MTWSGVWMSPTARMNPPHMESGDLETAPADLASRSAATSCPAPRRPDHDVAHRVLHRRHVQLDRRVPQGSERQHAGNAVGGLEGVGAIGFRVEEMAIQC